MADRRAPTPQGIRTLAAGVRFRTTVVAVVVVAAVLVLAGVALQQATRRRLESSVASSAETRAADIAVLAAAGSTGGSLSGRGGDLFAQVVAADGSVVVYSTGLDGFPPVVPARPAPGDQVRLELSDVFEGVETDAVEDEGPYVVIVRGVAGPEGTATVIVGASFGDAERAVGVIASLLWVGVPIVLAVVAVLVWSLTGRALRPVDAMRREAARISAADLDRRLPEPRSRDEVFRLAETLNEMLDRLESAATRQRRFVADASHELKTPVAAIRTMLEVTRGDPSQANWEQFLDDLERENRRSERLVRDLLVLAAADDGAIGSRRVAVDLDRVAGRVVDDLRTHATARIDTSGIGPGRVGGDPDALDRMVRNLVENAVRHATSMVWVASGSDGNSVVLEVSDDGGGIAPEDRERVFERFVRLDDARSRATGGSGLGLAVVRTVVRSHGGEVEVVDPRHGGATIEVRLPRGVTRPRPGSLGLWVEGA